jgi:uncharacterized RDD family membrane protein YckC
MKEIHQIKIKPVEKPTRFLNFLIDTIIFMFIVFLHAMVLDVWLGIVPEGGFELFPLYLMGLYVLYHWGFEYYFQKTPGKFITKTKVVGKNGRKVGASKLFVRNLSRVIPFEVFSFLFSDRGWHDLISETYVVKVEKS